MGKQQTYSTKDIVTLVVIAVISGTVGAGWGYVWSLASTVPVIGGMLSASLSFVWFVAPLVSFHLIRKPRAAAITQFLAGFVAILAGHPAGVVAYGWFVLQAVGAEVGFAVFRYRRCDIMAMMLAGFLQSITYGWGILYFRLYNFGLAAWLWPWAATFATGWLAGPIGLGIARALGRAGIHGSSQQDEISHDYHR